MNTKTRKNIEEITEILDKHCNGSYNYIEDEEGNFSHYIKCCELDKEYTESACSLCPYGKQLIKLGREFSTKEELKEDDFSNKRSYGGVKKESHWTEEELECLALLMSKHMKRDFFLDSDKIKEEFETIFPTERTRSAFKRKVNRMQANEKGERTNRTSKLRWTKKKKDSLRSFLALGNKPSQFKRGSSSLMDVYLIANSFKKETHKKSYGGNSNE